MVVADADPGRPCSPWTTNLAHSPTSFAYCRRHTNWYWRPGSSRPTCVSPPCYVDYMQTNTRGHQRLRAPIANSSTSEGENGDGRARCICRSRLAVGSVPLLQRGTQRRADKNFQLSKRHTKVLSYKVATRPNFVARSL